MRIEKVKKPKVGKYYTVPCVWVGDWWTPIIGPWHEDSDIGVKRYHFHYDVRFFPDSAIDVWGSARNLVRIKFADEHKQIEAGSQEDKNAVPRIRYLRRKMFREMPDFPALTLDGEAPQLQKILQAKFKGVKMKCMTCPHRGMDLKQLPVKDGAVVCNGHGLKWNVKTGKMIPR